MNQTAGKRANSGEESEQAGCDAEQASGHFGGMRSSTRRGTRGSPSRSGRGTTGAGGSRAAIIGGGDRGIWRACGFDFKLLGNCVVICYIRRIGERNRIAGSGSELVWLNELRAVGIIQVCQIRLAGSEDLGVRIEDNHSESANLGVSAGPSECILAALNPPDTAGGLCYAETLAGGIDSSGLCIGGGGGDEDGESGF